MFLFMLLLIPDTTLYASESSTYEFKWLDADKEVYVLQNRKFRKKQSLYLNAGGGLTASGAFVDGQNVQARAGFFFLEEWGIEGIYSKNFGQENVTAKSVRNSKGTGSIPFRRIADSYYGGMIMWSPFYAKINTFNKIFYFDWLFGVGYGLFNENNNRNELDTSGASTKTVSESHNSFMWDIGWKFYITEHLSTRFDVTTLHYSAKRGVSNTSATTYFSHYDLALSLGLTF